MKGKPIPYRSRALSDKCLSERRALLLCGKLSLQAFVSSLFEGRNIKSVRLENKHFWRFEFQTGPAAYIETVVTNKGCNGLMAGDL